MTPLAAIAASIAAIISGPAGPTADATPTFTFTGDAAECRMDTGAWTDCADEYTAAQLSDGAHLFAVRAKDRSSSDSRSFRVDTVAPEITLEGEQDITVADIRTTVSFNAPEGGVTLTCGIDSDAAVPCTSPWTTPALANGQHSVRVIATDEAGNEGVATKLVKIAAPSPETVLDGLRGNVRQRELTYGVSSDRPGSTFECKVDEGAWAPCEASFKTPALSPGAHTILARATDAAGNVDPTPAGAEITVADCETKVTIGALEAVSECFTKNTDGQYVGEGTVKVNGITFNGLPGRPLLFDPANRKVSLGRVHLKLGSMTLYKGDLAWTVPEGDRITLATIDMKTFRRTDDTAGDSEAALDLEGDDGANVQGFELAGEAKIELVKGGKTVFSGNVELPKVFTDAEGNGLSGAVQVEASNEGGVKLAGIQIKAPLVFVGKVEIHNFWVNFAGENSGKTESTCNADTPGIRWEGGAEKVVLPTPDKLTVESVGMGFADGAFNYARGTLNGGQPGLSIGGGLRVQRIAISLCAGPPVTVEGRIGLTALPGANGDPRLSIPNAGLLFKGGDPWSLRAEAPTATFKGDRDYAFKDVFVQYASSGAIDFGARVNFALGLKGPVPLGTLDAAVTIDAGIAGWIEGGKFNADVDAKGCFAGSFTVADALPLTFKDLCPTVKGVLSSKGIALCGELVVGDKNVGGVGVGYAWGGELKFMAGTCDVKTWRETRQAAASAVGGAKSVRLPGGQRGVLVSIRGIGRAPHVKLVGPGGASIETPADSNEAVKTKRGVAFVNRGESTTYVVLAAPRGGRWTVKPLDGAQIASVRTAGLRPPARVSAKVHGAKTLQYRIPKVKGQTVTFEERGQGVAHVLGTVKAGGTGSLRFKPADGKGGQRRIIARVEQDGLPRKQLTVATYTAPPRAKPGTPSALKIKVPGTFKKAKAAAAKRAPLTITWRAAKGAARYGVRVALPDGRKLFFLRNADDRVVRINDVPADGRAVVRVVGLRKDNTTGPAATANTSLSKGTR